MNSRRRQQKPIATDGGFTLLEIMVAIFIFSILITTVFGSFRIVFSSADAVGGDVSVYESARTCLGRMAIDLEGLVISDYPRYRKPEFNDPPEIYQFAGDWTDLAGSRFGRLRFASLSHLALNRDSRQGVCRIVYYVHEDIDGSLVLRRADHLYPFPEFEENEDDPILCKNLLALEFNYLDDEGEKNDRWDSESADTEYATPRSVDIKLTVGKEDRPMTFSTRMPLYVYRRPIEE